MRQPISLFKSLLALTLSFCYALQIEDRGKLMQPISNYYSANLACYIILMLTSYVS